MSGKSSRFASQWSAYAKRKPQYHIHTIQPYPTLLPAMCVCGVSVCSCMYACTGICMHAHGSKTRFRGLRIHQSWTPISVAWCCPEHGLVHRLPVGALGRSQLGPVTWGSHNQSVQGAYATGSSSKDHHLGETNRFQCLDASVQTSHAYKSCHQQTL